MEDISQNQQVPCICVRQS